MSEFAEAPVEEDKDDAVAAMFDLTQKKKKRKSKKVEVTESGEQSNDADQNASESAAAGNSAAGNITNMDPPQYSYSQLLNRVVDYLHLNNPDLIEKRRYTMKPPQLMRVGTKKTLWVNFQEICNTMKRNPEHLFQFMMAELGTEGSIDGNKRLVIRGKFVPKYIESLLRKYIGEYVTCQMCRSFNTSLTRDSVSRLYFVHCQDCGSSKSVAQIRAGYHAETRADRRAQRNA